MTYAYLYVSVIGLRKIIGCEYLDAGEWLGEVVNWHDE